MPVLSLVLLVLAVGAVSAAWISRRPALQSAALLLAGALLASVAAIGLLEAQQTPSSWQHASLLAASAALAVAGGGPLTTAVFGLVDGHEAAPTSGAETGSMEQAGQVLRGGAWIGALERAAVFATLVAGWPEGLAVVLGLKGLGRYPELRSNENSGIAERFIIGTFTSVLWAAACAGCLLLLI